MSRPLRRAAPWLVLLGIALLSFDLRPAAVSVGPVLAEVQAGLGLSGTTAGLLTSLPVLAFAGFGAAAPALARRLGPHRVALAAVVVLVVGLTGRAFTGSGAVFLALTMLALAGMAAANVLMPALVKQHFPHRIGPVTALYTTCLAIGLTAALTLTVPIAELGGSWRVGLGAWAVIAALSALPWLLLAREDRHRPPPDPAERPVSLLGVARTRLGLGMAVFFGVQSLHAYVIFGWFPLLWREAGYSAATAGALVGLLAGVSIPLSLLLPAYAARRDDQRAVCLAVIACYPVGYGMLLLAPYALAVPAALLLGVACCAFPLVLTLINLRARTAAGTAGMSGFAQGAGYLLAAGGPFATGAIHEATGGWTLILVLLLLLSAPLAALTGVVARPGHVEDHLR